MLAGARLPDRAIFPTPTTEVPDPFERANRADLPATERIAAWCIAANELNAGRADTVALPTTLSEKGTLPLESRWYAKGRGNVIISAEIPREFNTDKAVVLGGVCSLFPGDVRELIVNRRELGTPGTLEGWLRSWYPRFDQVRDTVGTPPAAAKRVVYVVEDSLWARRIGSIVDLPPSDIAPLLKDLHTSRGAPAIERWLREGGFKGTIEVVYTSTLDRELEIGLKAFECFTGADCRDNRDRAKIQLMYTGLWPRLLGISGQAVVFEPADHGFESSAFKEFGKGAPYGKPGANSEIGFIRTMPAASADGPSRDLPAALVPNLGNWESFRVSNREAFWTALNLWPRDTLNRPVERRFDAAEIERRMRMDLAKIFG
jgi:hypothetical protein